MATKMVMTRGVADKIADNTKFAKFVTNSMGRFLRKDWGDVCDEDKQANDSEPWNELAAYTQEDLPKIWIKSDDFGHGQRIITVLFPDEW